MSSSTHTSSPQASEHFAEDWNSAFSFEDVPTQPIAIRFPSEVNVKSHWQANQHRSTQPVFPKEVYPHIGLPRLPAAHWATRLQYSYPMNQKGGGGNSYPESLSASRPPQHPENPSKRQRKAPESSSITLAFPGQFMSMVTSVYDPVKDGNCGFRCIAQALGYDEESRWLRVRNEMVEEMEKNKQLYETIFPGSYDEIKEATAVVDANEEILPNKWLSAFDHGPILANAYNRPISFISPPPARSFSFLPLKRGPEETTGTDPIYLYNHAKHWYLLGVRNKDGVWPIPKYPKSTKDTKKEAEEWQTLTKKWVELFEQCLKGNQKS